MAKYADSAHLSSGSPSSSASYAYDHQNRLIGRSYNPDGSPDANSVQTAFVYDGNQIVMHFEKTTAVANELAITNSLAHRYLWGPAGRSAIGGRTGNQLSQRRHGSLAAGRPLETGPRPGHVQLDHQRDHDRGPSGFDSYGNCTSETPSPSVKCLFYYTGRPLWIRALASSTTSTAGMTRPSEAG